MGLIWAGGEYGVTATDPRKPGTTIHITSLETPEPTIAVELRAVTNLDDVDKVIRALGTPRPEPVPIWVPALMAVCAAGYGYILLRVLEETFRRLVP